MMGAQKVSCIVLIALQLVLLLMSHARSLTSGSSVDMDTRSALTLSDILIRKTAFRWQSNLDTGTRRDTLVAFTAANVGHRTSAFLASLSTTRDHFDVIAVDEHSSDNTPQDLATYNVSTLYVNEFIGVTALWNLAYKYYLEHGYDKLIYSNNDVLVPNGVIDKLRAALDAGCDLVSPLSTVRGKGHMGMHEGIEVGDRGIVWHCLLYLSHAVPASGVVWARWRCRHGCQQPSQLPSRTARAGHYAA